jgi:hypothetical protein
VGMAEEEASRLGKAVEDLSTDKKLG